MRLYICGPMTGKPEYNYPAFDEARDLLKSLGHEAISPADITRAYWYNWHGVEFDPKTMSCEYGSKDTLKLIERDIDTVIWSEGLVLLPGWESSKGACREVAIADWFGNKKFFRISHGKLRECRVTVGVTVSLFVMPEATPVR